MKEKKIKLILDGGQFKLSYTNDENKQMKVSIGSEKDITVVSARKITEEVEKLIISNSKFDVLEKLYYLNEDTKRAGYDSRLILFKNVSIESVMKIKYPVEYVEFKNRQNDKNTKKTEIEDILRILNVGCTSVGKTLFVLSTILNKENGLNNFLPVLTSIKETTACSISYHVNQRTNQVKRINDFSLDVEIKTQEEVKDDIGNLIFECVDEFITSIKNSSKTKDDINEIRAIANKSVQDRLSLNYDKTFGMGRDIDINEDTKNIEELVSRAMLDFYGNSKSIDRMAEKDDDFVIRQLIIDAKNSENGSSDDENVMLMFKYENDELFKKMIEVMYKRLKLRIEKLTNEHKIDVRMGKILTIVKKTDDNDVKNLLSHIFGNKRMVRDSDFYAIDVFVKRADFYFYSENINQKLTFFDGVGINQGQKDRNNILDKAMKKIVASVQTIKPDIVLYHTKIDLVDNYMINAIEELNRQGYGMVTSVVSGNLDKLFFERVEEDADDDELNEGVDSKYLDNFINEINGYIQKDSVTLEPIIGNRFYICDKKSNLENKLKEKDKTVAEEYYSNNVLTKILLGYEKKIMDELDCNEEYFMEFLQNNNICSNVYEKFLNYVPQMIPLEYNKMRWNTLQKAINELYRNNWGFDVLCPAINANQIIAAEFDIEENKAFFEEQFGDNSDEVKKTYIIELTDILKTVLVTEYQFFMLRLLNMRYDREERTNLSTSMTNDRKYNLQKLYNECLQKDGLRGEYSMKMIFHIAWNRMVYSIEK